MYELVTMAKLDVLLVFNNDEVNVALLLNCMSNSLFVKNSTSL